MGDSNVSNTTGTLNVDAGGNSGGGTRSRRGGRRNKTIADKTNDAEKELEQSEKDKRRVENEIENAQNVTMLGMGLRAIADTEDKKQTAERLIAVGNEMQTTKRDERDIAHNKREAAKVELEPLKKDLDAARTAAREEETERRDVMRPLCTGRLPQNPVLIKARIDPTAVFGRWHIDHADFPPEYYACPQYVPVFTSVCGLKHMYGNKLNRNGKRGREGGGEMILPVTAHVPSAARIQTFGCDEPDLELIFVGIAYNSVSRTSLVTVASGGQMPIPHERTKDDFYKLIGAPVWWKRSNDTYGDVPGLRIAVPTLLIDMDEDVFVDPKKSACRFIVQQSTMMDCAVLLGV